METKTYQITSQTGEHFFVKGKFLTQCEMTGQIFIYSEKDPIWKNIVAVIPKESIVLLIS